MAEQLYRRVQQGQRVRYEAHQPEQPQETVLNFTDAQCITAAGALGATLLIIFERNIPQHKKVARKIRAVEDAILELFRGTGEPLDREIAELFCATWDKTMRELST